MKVTRFLLILTVLHPVYTKNPFIIQSDNVHMTTDVKVGTAALFIENKNANLVINLTATLPTNVNILLRLWHRNPRGKYDPVGIPWTGNACKFIKTDKFVYDSLRKRENTELPDKCPIVPGRYFVMNYDPNEITIPIPLPLGQYRLEVRGVSGKAELAKATWNGRLIPAQ